MMMSVVMVSSEYINMDFNEKLWVNPCNFDIQTSNQPTEISNQPTEAELKLSTDNFALTMIDGSVKLRALQMLTNDTYLYDLKQLKSGIKSLLVGGIIIRPQWIDGWIPKLIRKILRDINQLMADAKKNFKDVKVDKNTWLNRLQKHVVITQIIYTWILNTNELSEYIEEMNSVNNVVKLLACEYQQFLRDTDVEFRLLQNVKKWDMYNFIGEIFSPFTKRARQ